LPVKFNIFKVTENFAGFSSNCVEKKTNFVSKKLTLYTIKNLPYVISVDFVGKLFRSLFFSPQF
jgi:hypothetical protein